VLVFVAGLAIGIIFCLLVVVPIVGKFPSYLARVIAERELFTEISPGTFHHRAQCGRHWIRAFVAASDFADWRFSGRQRI
jgi:hypothetical protein